MKILFILSFVIAMALSNYNASANIFELKSKKDTIQGLLSTELKTEAYIQNNGMNEVQARVSMKVLNFTSGHKISVCWGGLCLIGKDVDFTTQTKAAIPAGEEVHFYATLTSAIEGITSANFTIWDIADSANNNITYNAYFYNGVTSVSEELPSIIANTAPNPATQFVKTVFNSTTTEEGMLNIYNQSGMLVQQFSIPAGLDEFEFNILNLADGFYFYNITIGNKIYQASKFVVVH